jgi:hypothetical protein
VVAAGAALGVPRKQHVYLEKQHVYLENNKRELANAASAGKISG